MSEELEILTGTMEAKMIERAKEAGVVPTENTHKIASVRTRFGLDISVCPCAKNDPDRGCISAKCLREIKDEGICHCHCFKRSEDGAS